VVKAVLKALQFFEQNKDILFTEVKNTTLPSVSSMPIQREKP